MPHTADIDLSDSQKHILTVVIDLFRDRDTGIEASAVAEETGDDPEDLERRIQSLHALRLVETKRLNGDELYKPTPNAFDSLGIDMTDTDEKAAVPILRNGETVDGVNVAEIDLTDVHNPNDCTAEIHVRGTVSAFEVGDSVEVGPTPASNLLIHGEVTHKIPHRNVVVCHICEMKIR